MKTEYEQRIINWMKNKEFIIGIEAKSLSEDKKKMMKILGYALKAASFVIDVPASVRANTFVAGLSGSENEFRDALSKLSEITSLIGTSMGGFVLLWIDGDKYNWQEIQSLVKKAFKDSEGIQILIKVGQAPFYIYPIFVFSNLNCFNKMINQDLDSLPVQSSMFWTNRHVLPAFVDANNKIIKWCKLKGMIGTINRSVEYPIKKLSGLFTSKEMSVLPLKNQDIKDIF